MIQAASTEVAFLLTLNHFIWKNFQRTKSQL